VTGSVVAAWWAFWRGAGAGGGSRVAKGPACCACGRCQGDSPIHRADRSCKGFRGGAAARRRYEAAQARRQERLALRKALLEHEAGRPSLDGTLQPLAQPQMHWAGELLEGVEEGGE
jgi:hypothetical protein